MKRQIIAAAAAVLAVATFAAPARSAVHHVYVSGPGGAFANYTVPVLVVLEGDTAEYRNFDIAAHDVRSVRFGPDRAWCTQFPFSFPSGRCPLFTSRLISLTQTSRIHGVEDVDVPPGETVGTYDFFCTIHPAMFGKLVVVDPALT